MSYNRDPIFWISWLKGAIFAGIAIVSWILVRLRRQTARNWPMTYGSVELGISTDVDNRWIADLSYSYKAGTEFYSGRIVLRAKNEEDADEIIRRWNGQTLVVRYSPTRPELSVIRIEDQQSWADSDLRLARVLGQ